MVVIRKEEAVVKNESNQVIFIKYNGGQLHEKKIYNIDIVIIT